MGVFIFSCQTFDINFFASHGLNNLSHCKTLCFLIQTVRSYNQALRLATKMKFSLDVQHTAIK